MYKTEKIAKSLPKSTSNKSIIYVITKYYYSAFINASKIE